MIRVPARLAKRMYLVVTGWLLARSVPIKIKRSVPIMSESEHVGAPQPMVAFKPTADAA